MKKFKVRTKLWRWTGKGAWFFMTIPKTKAEQILKLERQRQLAWGTLKVEATIGKTTWSTALFRIAKDQTYLLPVKAMVRKKEKLEADKLVTVTLSFPKAKKIDDIFAEMDD